MYEDGCLCPSIYAICGGYAHNAPATKRATTLRIATPLEASCHRGPTPEDAEVVAELPPVTVLVMVTPPDAAVETTPVEPDDIAEAPLLDELFDIVPVTDPDALEPDFDAVTDADAELEETTVSVAPATSGSNVPLGMPVPAADAEDTTDPGRLAKPTAAGEDLKTVYVFLRSVSPTTHCTGEFDDSD